MRSICSRRSSSSTTCCPTGPPRLWYLDFARLPRARGCSSSRACRTTPCPRWHRASAPTRTWARRRRPQPDARTPTRFGTSADPPTSALDETLADGQAEPVSDPRVAGRASLEGLSVLEDHAQVVPPAGDDSTTASIRSASLPARRRGALAAWRRGEGCCRGCGACSPAAPRGTGRSRRAPPRSPRWCAADPSCRGPRPTRSGRAPRWGAELLDGRSRGILRALALRQIAGDLREARQPTVLVVDRSDGDADPERVAVLTDAPPLLLVAAPSGSALPCSTTGCGHSGRA